MCGISGVKGLFGGDGSKNGGASGNEALDSQHGTGVGKSSHPRTKGYSSK